MNDLDAALVIILDAEESSDKETVESESELFKKRRREGAYEVLVCRHLFNAENKFKEYFRLTPMLFDYILNYIKEDITSNPTNRIPHPLSAKQKLCVFLRFLATGESFRSLAFQFRISHSWISSIIRQVSTSIVNRMLEIVIPPPTEGHLLMVSNKFMSQWNFPNCVGAIDGKHIRLKAPSNTGSLFYNYKEFYSMVMLVIVDAECKFIAVDIGSYGREGDAGVTQICIKIEYCLLNIPSVDVFAGIYLKSKFGRQIQENEFTFPPPRTLPGLNVTIPHVLVGDAAFSLHEHLMKPYPRRQSVNDKSKAVYNYRLSRARRTTENTFGIMCAYFRIFFQPIATAPEVTDKVITCACILHNILRDANIPLPTHANNKEQLPLPSKNLIPLIQINFRGPNIPLQIRETLRIYFNGTGAVEWQENYYQQH